MRSFGADNSSRLAPLMRKPLCPRLGAGLGPWAGVCQLFGTDHGASCCLDHGCPGPLFGTMGAWPTTMTSCVGPACLGPLLGTIPFGTIPFGTMFGTMFGTIIWDHGCLGPGVWDHNLAPCVFGTMVWDHRLGPGCLGPTVWGRAFGTIGCLGPAVSMGVRDQLFEDHTVSNHRLGPCMFGTMVPNGEHPHGPKR